MSEEDEIRERLFSRSKYRRPNADLIILAETGTVDISDPDVAAWALHTVRRKFGFKEKDE